MSARDAPAVTLPTVIRGAALGAVAYLAGYLLAFVTAVGELQRLVRGYVPLAEAGARFAPEWKLAGWAFYDAQFVGTRFPGQSVNVVSFAGVEFLYLVPPVLLLLAGGAVAWLSGSEESRDGLRAGATVAAGYVTLVVVLAVLVRHVNVQPSFLRALVVAGIVYPVAFGGVGALAAVLRADGGES